jgi:hypothetical protein
MAGRILFVASCRIITSIYDPRAPEKAISWFSTPAPSRSTVSGLSQVLYAAAHQKLSQRIKRERRLEAICRTPGHGESAIGFSPARSVGDRHGKICQIHAQAVFGVGRCFHRDVGGGYGNPLWPVTAIDVARSLRVSVTNITESKSAFFDSGRMIRPLKPRSLVLTPRASLRPNVVAVAVGLALGLALFLLSC